MKRFACHRLYIFADGCYSNYVIELGADSRVCAHFPLKEEISATQWVGGVIVLSPSADLIIEKEESFHAFLKRVVDDTHQAVYAWHIDNFDFKKNEFTPHSRLTRLH